MDEGALAGTSHRLPKDARLTEPEQIRGLFRRGKRRKTRHLDVFVSASPVACPRVGIVVPKPRAKTAVGPRGARGAAVQRNRLKRRLKEISRTILLPALRAHGRHVDVLVRARAEAYGAGYAELKDELTSIQEWLCSSAR